MKFQLLASELNKGYVAAQDALSYAFATDRQSVKDLWNMLDGCFFQ